MGCSSYGLLSWRRSGSRHLSAPEGLDDAHLPAAVGAWPAQCEGWCRLIRWLVWFRRFDVSKQRADPGDFLFVTGSGQEAVVEDTVESVWQNMHQEAADELEG